MTDYNSLACHVSGGMDKQYKYRDEIYMLNLHDAQGWVLLSHLITPRAAHAVSTISFDQDLEEECY